ncbi:PRA1 family protein D-like [Euphorbia lathyris]|uniref:PRA1 family protein D-like n=1 Tax=Euphorbia lathyris TaxID=212925 RepID=UPI0033133742
MSNTPQFLSEFNQTTRSLKATLRPWSSFLDLSFLNFPSSVPDATTRITQNLTHFRSNYSLLIFIVLFLSLLYHPLSLIAFFITFVAWVFLYFSRDEPLSVFGYQVNDLVVLALLFSATILVLVWSSVWLNVVVAIAVGVALVVLHAVLRSTDDLVADDNETSPYANLLSDDDSPRGGL